MTDTPNEPLPRLVLASSSVYRRALLDRLGLEFDWQAPSIDESALPGEEPGETTGRLARQKAQTVAAGNRGAIVIGSDQVAVRDGEALGKPGSAEQAFAQLKASSGRAVEFLTGVCVIDTREPGNEPYLHMDITRVAFRPLADEEIERYVATEQPLDCAGGFKVEGLGISLFERIDSRDPTGLVGLPLIWLSGVLRHLGLRVP